MKTSACRDGTLKSQPNKIGMTPQYFHNTFTILSHHPYILCHFATYALCLLFVCIGGLWKAVGWVVLHRCVVHYAVHGERMLWVAATL